MKLHIIQVALLIVALTWGSRTACAQSDINAVLQRVEASSRELQARRMLTSAQKIEARTGNFLPDPTIEYEMMWGNSSASGKAGELTVAQAFDFPTAYVQRHKIAQLKGQQYDSEGALFRQDLLLRAKELCLEIIYLHKHNSLLQERSKLAEELHHAYQQKLQVGSTNILAYNKIEIEKVTTSTALSLNESALQNALQQLQTLCGGEEVNFTVMEYEITSPLPAFALLEELYMGQNLTLQGAVREQLVNSKMLSLSRSMSLPKLEVGYRQDYSFSAVEQFRGFKVGMSLPLFENTNRIKSAKAMLRYNESQLASIEENSRATLRQLYARAQHLASALERLQTLTQTQQNVTLLNRALAAGEISVIDYFVEVSSFYQSREIQLSTERDYQIVLCQINRFLL